MDDLISRRAAIEAVVYELDMIDHVPQRIFDRLTKRIKELPSIFQPQKGKWIYYDPNGFKCSRCGRYLEIECGDVKMNFCPHCGADMRGGLNV